MQETYTEDLSKFGYRERVELERILHAWNENGLPDGFECEQVRPAFNMNSGNVFLVNADYQTAMLNGDTLELWHFLPYSGQEGFLSDLLEECDPASLNAEDLEYLQTYAPDFGATLEI
jgi:hypothetical protein